MTELALRPGRRLRRPAVHRQSGRGDAARRLAADDDAPGDRDGEQSQRDRLHWSATRAARPISNCAGSRRRTRCGCAAMPRWPAAMSLIGEIADRIGAFRTRRAGHARGRARRRTSGYDARLPAWRAVAEAAARGASPRWASTGSSRRSGIQGGYGVIVLDIRSGGARRRAGLPRLAATGDPHHRHRAAARPTDVVSRVFAPAPASTRIR